MTSQVFTGTATGPSDLVSKIIGHLTTGLGAQNWQQLAATAGWWYLKGPGLSGTDDVYVQLAPSPNVGADIFTVYARASVGYNPLVGLDLQPGISPYAIMPVWDAAMPYWLIANGRRFIIITKVSTTYQSMYCGFYLPYATSSEMPYPMAVMGCASAANRWSSGNYTTGGFWDPVQNSSYIRFWDGAWVNIYNYETRTDGQRYERHDNSVWPFEYDYALSKNRDDSYGILPAIVHGNYSSPNIYGELEGVYFVSGFSNAAEDILTIGADQYLVVQSVYRNGRRDYAAIKLG